MEEITINIMIAERTYKLTVDRTSEERVRKAAAYINDRLKDYAKAYAYKDFQDLLAMTALQFAITSLQFESDLKYRDSHLDQKLSDLDGLLNTHLLS